MNWIQFLKMPKDKMIQKMNMMIMMITFIKFKIKKNEIKKKLFKEFTYSINVLIPDLKK